jgi:hypothetical protein
MKVDLVSKIGRVYDIHAMDIFIGESFTLIGRSKEQFEWLSNNDPVLLLSVIENVAQVQATSLGTSVIVIMNETFDRKVKEIVIKVVDNPNDNVIASLNFSADNPIPKP